MATSTPTRPDHHDLVRALAALGEDVHRDGFAAHTLRVTHLGEAVRRHSPAVAEVLVGGFVEPMRERALARAVHLVLQRADEHDRLGRALARVR